MLAELAAANAAFAVIKTAIQNGRELASVGSEISKFVHSQETLRQKQLKKKSSMFGDDFQEFMALEELKKKEADLRSYMQLYGRPGLYQDWIEFQRKARVERQQQQLEAHRKQQQLVDSIIIGSGVVAIILLIMFIGFFIVEAI